MSEPLNTRRSRSLSIEAPQIDQRITIWDDISPLSPEMLKHAGIEVKEDEARIKLARPDEAIQKKLDTAVEHYESSSRIITEAKDNEERIDNTLKELEARIIQLETSNPQKASELKNWKSRLEEAKYVSRKIQVDDFYDNKVLVRSVYWKVLNRTGYVASENLAIRIREEESREVTYRETKKRQYEQEGSM